MVLSARGDKKEGARGIRDHLIIVSCNWEESVDLSKVHTYLLKNSVLVIQYSVVIVGVGCIPVLGQ